MEQTHSSDAPYRYDAFISYRHLPLDMAVATRLQELLESYRPPKTVAGLSQQRISRVFRDTSELPTSGDLGNDISQALESSRYLIVICSEHIRESRWCMEEINLFKRHHGGRTNRILPLLISGEPGEVFPEQLLTETRTRTGEDGSQQTVDVMIEPLCADVRAETPQKSLKRLKTEFLRIAAPILGCSFDTLYQRHLRRRKRRGAIALSASLGLLSAVLLVVSLFAYQTWRSERAYRETLAENYMMQGSEQAFADQPQQALMYFAQALSAAPGEMPAAYAGAALLMQDYAWPTLEQELPGTILDGAYSPYGWAVSQLDGTYYLRQSLSALQVCDSQGSVLRTIALSEDEYATLLSASAGQWGFRVESLTDWQSQRLMLYSPGEDRTRLVEQPQDVSRCYDPDISILDGFSIAAVDDDHAIVTGAGLVRLLAFDGSGSAQTLRTADLADAFPTAEKAQSVSGINDLWLSDDCSLAAVRHLNSIAIYETDTLVLRGTIDTPGYSITDVTFGQNGTLALSCGNSYSLGGSHVNPGGLFGVYRTDGQVVYQSEPDQENAFLGAVFAPENDGLLLVWSKNMAAVFDLSQGRFLTAPVCRENITSACFSGEGSICVASSVNTLQSDAESVNSLAQYRYISLGAPQASLAEGEGEIHTVYESEKRTAAGPDGMSLVCDGRTLTMYDAGGNPLSSRELPVFLLSSRIALSADGAAVYVGDSTYYSGLLIAPVDFEGHTIGDFLSADTAGGTALNLWALENCAAVETSARDIMVFRPDGTRIFSAVPRHNSMPVAVAADPLNRYIAVYLEETTTEQDVIGYDQNSYIEVWDIASGLLIADYELPGKQLHTLGITREGALVWSTSTRTYSRLIPSAPPDREAVAFLTSLCSLTLNERQEDISQTPVRLELAPESWYSALGGWEDFSFPTAETADAPSLSDAADRLSQMDDAGSPEWIARCDDVWRQLADGDIPYTAAELDRFFALYSSGASRYGLAGEIGYGLEQYFQLSIRLIGATTEPVDSYLISNLLPLLCETTAYDGFVAQQLLDIAALNDRDIAQRDAEMETEPDEMERFLWEEIDRPTLLVSSSQFRAWAACLTNEEPLAAWRSALECCLENPTSLCQLGDFYATVCLLGGDAADSVQIMNEALALETLGLSEEELGYFEEYLAGHLESLDLMLLRGLIDPQLADTYLRGLNVSFGIEVLGVGAEAQAGGIRLGDRIVSIDGQMVTSLARAERLLAQEGAQCVIQRGEEQITVPSYREIRYGLFCSLS